MTKIDDEIAQIRKKMEQQTNRLRDLKARATKQERRDDARRKLLYGAAYLAALPSLGNDARKQSLARIEAFITRPKDREFLGLAPAKTSHKESNVALAPNNQLTADLPFGNGLTDN